MERIPQRIYRAAHSLGFTAQVEVGSSITYGGRLLDGGTNPAEKIVNVDWRTRLLVAPNDPIKPFQIDQLNSFLKKIRMLLGTKPTTEIPFSLSWTEPSDSNSDSLPIPSLNLGTLYYERPNKKEPSNHDQAYVHLYPSRAHLEYVKNLPWHEGDDAPAGDNFYLLKWLNYADWRPSLTRATADSGDKVTAYS